MERRYEERTDTHVQLTCRVPARPCQAVMHDLSHAGCRLEVAHANVELGGTALIDFPGAQVSGRVMWVRGNQAGILFHRRLRGAVAVALGLDEPEPEPQPEEVLQPADGQQLGGLLRHWMRRLTGKFT